ncbi:phage major capsid protein [bacterium]|nr:phage major capsid protein [bacterium]
MPDMTEIKGLVEKVNEALVPLRAEVDSIKAAQRDVVTETKFDKMAAQVTDAMEKLQAIEQKNAAIEAAFARRDAGNADGAKELEAKGRDALQEFKAGRDRGDLEIRAMATDTQQTGGFLVMPDLSSTVVSRVFETSPIRLVANVEQAGSKSREFLIDDDEAGATWSGERSVATDDTPDVGLKEIVTHEITSTMKATATMIEDAYLDLASWMQTKGADKISRTENTAFFTGTGIKQPRGLLTYAAWASAGVYERDKIEQIASGGATTLTADGLIDTQAALKEAYQAQAVWLMKRATFGSIIKLKGADNFYFGPMMLAQGVPTMQLLGRRVMFCDDMQALGTGSNLVCAYGDFGRAYTILDRVGLQVLRDPFTADPYTLFRLRRRTGGDVTSFDAVKLTKLAAS